MERQDDEFGVWDLLSLRYLQAVPWKSLEGCWKEARAWIGVLCTGG